VEHNDLSMRPIGTPFLLDIFDIDDGSGDRVDIGVRLLEAAMAEVVPAGVKSGGPAIIRS
jgi:hypothetical protein